jgi:peptide chain release factor 1
MVPIKKIEELIAKHSLLEKELSSGQTEKKQLLRNQKSIQILMVLLNKPTNTVLSKKKKMNWKKLLTIQVVAMSLLQWLLTN